ESWVLGTRSELAPNSAEARRLEQDVIALYTADYAKQWDGMLNDLNIGPLRNPQQASQDLYLLASPQSPMRDLLTAIARQLTLSQPPPGLPGAGAAAAAGSAAAAAGKQAAGQAATEAASNAARAVVPYAAQGVAQQSLSAAAAQPVRRWLEAMITSGTAIRTGSTAEEVKKAFSAPGGPATLCHQAVAGRYPFSPGATNEIPLDDFAKLLSPGGLLDGFFNTQL